MCITGRKSLALEFKFKFLHTHFSNTSGDLPWCPQEVEVVLGAPLLEEVEEVFLLAVPMEEEEEPPALGVVVVAKDHHPLSDSV